MKEVNDGAYFWHADKHRSLLQVDTIILGLCATRHAQSTQNKCISLHISRSMGVKFIFCSQIKAKVFYKLIIQYRLESA